MADERYSVDDRLGMLKINLEQDRKNIYTGFAYLGGVLDQLEEGQAKILSSLTASINRLQTTVEELRDDVSAKLSAALGHEQAPDSEIESLRSRVRTLQHSQDTLVEQCSVLFRKLGRLEDRLAALEGKGA